MTVVEAEAVSRTAAFRFGLSSRRLRNTLKRHAETDEAIARSLARYGFPRERRQPAGFPTLVRALAGQQLSVKAAATIYGRILTHCEGELEPVRLSRVRTSTLRRLGLSERKAESLRTLARAVLDGALQLDSFDRLPDADIIAQISSVRGFGVWSAQMYLIFSLGRPDVWPVDDMGVQKGLQALLALPQSPNAKLMARLGERYAPERSAVALLCWHIKNNPAL